MQAEVRRRRARRRGASARALRTNTHVDWPAISSQFSPLGTGDQTELTHGPADGSLFSFRRHAANRRGRRVPSVGTCGYGFEHGEDCRRSTGLVDAITRGPDVDLVANWVAAA